MPSQTYSPLDTRPSTPPSDDEVLVRVEGVSKKFCRSLKKSLWYGVCDIASELLPRRKRQEKAYLTTIEHGGQCKKEQPQVGPKGERVGTSESKDTESTEGKAGLGLEGQAGTAFSNPSTSELALDSENTLLIRAANEPRLSGQKNGSDSESAKISEICGAPAENFNLKPENSAPPASDWVYALKDVSFEVKRGEVLGIIGRNGAGNQAAGQPLGRLPQGSPKGEMSGSERINTTLLRRLNGLIKPDRGSITMRGRVGALIALGAGFNPILTTQN